MLKKKPRGQQFNICDQTNERATNSGEKSKLGKGQWSTWQINFAVLITLTN